MAPADAAADGGKTRAALVDASRRVVHRVGNAIMRASGVRILGAERVPKHGRVVFAPNHDAALDAPIVGLASPRAMHFMAHTRVFRSPVRRAALAIAGAYEVNPGKSGPAIARTNELLAADRAVGIYPEGQVRAKHGGVPVLQGGPLRSGVGHFAAKNQAPVVPVLVRGAAELQDHLLFRLSGGKKGARRPPGSRVEVVFGDPIYPPADGPDAAETITHRLGEALRALDRTHPSPVKRLRN